jgi:hypothetical protein
MYACVLVAGRVVEPYSGTEIVRISRALAMQEGQYQWIQISGVADVLYICINFVPKPQIQHQRLRNTPVVLNECRDVVIVCIRDDERGGRLGAPQRHRENEVIIVNSPIAVAVEIGKIFDQLDAALLEYAQIKGCSYMLNLASNLQGVVPPDHGKCVAKLEPPLSGFLGNPE